MRSSGPRVQWRLREDGVTWSRLTWQGLPRGAQTGNWSVEVGGEGEDHRKIGRGTSCVGAGEGLAG